MKCLCLQAMTVIYGQYFEEIGPFTDTKYILVKLEKASQLLINNNYNLVNILFLYPMIYVCGLDICFSPREYKNIFTLLKNLEIIKPIK